MRLLVSSLAICTLSLLGSSSASAQAPAPEPKVWTANAGAGLALTAGNKDTSTINASYDIVYDPQTRNVIKSDGLLIHGETDEELSADRWGVNVRDEYRFNDRMFVFGQNQYLHDRFKEIDYLVAPTAGVGYKFYDTEATKLGIDAGLGGVWEKNPGSDVHTSAAVTLGEKLSRVLTSTTSLTQVFSALWKADDFADGLYIFGAGVSVSMSTTTQLKVEVLDTFKNKPPSLDIDKNDVALLIAIVFKM